MSQSLQEVLRQFAAEVPQGIATMIAELDSGDELASISADPSFATAALAAPYAIVVKSNAKAMDLLELGAGTTEDILITLAPWNVLIRALGQRCYLGVVVAKSTPLNLARAVMKKWEGPLLTAINAVPGPSVLRVDSEA